MTEVDKAVGISPIPPLAAKFCGLFYDQAIVVDILFSFRYIMVGFEVLSRALLKDEMCIKWQS